MPLPIPPWFVLTVITVFGLIIGSFLNVIVYRVPAKLSIVPGSRCPKCDAPITWWQNVPVASWIILRGRCHECHEPISLRYPLVELGTAAAFWSIGAAVLATGAGAAAGAGWFATTTATTAFGTTLSASAWLALVALLYLAAISIALALIDLDTHTLPNAIVLPSYIVGVVLFGAAALSSGDLWPFVRALIGMATLWIAYFLMALAYPGGMGFGDVKLAGVLGLWLGFAGWGQLAVGAFAAFLLGGLFSLALLIAHRATRKSGIPFGPWMLVGAWVGLAVGHPLWSAYLALAGFGPTS